MARRVALIACGLASCLPAGALTSFAARPVSASNDVLLRAVEPRVGIASMGAASFARGWNWQPPRAPSLLVWVVCRGAGDTRACVLAFGRMEDARVRMLAEQPVGWSIPDVGLASSGGDELIVTGDDGHGTWRQLARYEREGGGAITFMRRQYADGF